MRRQIIAMLLCALVSWPYAVLAAEADGSPNRRNWAAAVREANAKGLNYVEFRLLDGRKVKGYVLSVYPESCSVREKAGEREIRYSDIRSAKWKYQSLDIPGGYANNALSRPAKYALIIGIGAVAFVLLGIMAGRS